MIKRLIVIFMLLVGFMFPITKAFAFLPLIYLAYAAAAGSELTPFLIGSATVVGTAIGLIRFSNTSNSTVVPINVTLDPTKPLVTPANWTPAPAGTQEPVPPQQSDPNMTVTIPKNIVDGSQHVFTGSSMADVKSQIYAFLAAPYAGFTLDLQYDASAHLMRLYENDPPSTVMNNYVNFPASLTCKSGYIPNSDASACELSDATQVKKPADNVCDYVKTATGAFKPSPNDPDCDSATVVGKNTSKLEYTTTTDHLIITSDGDGRVTITQKSYDSSANKTAVSVANLSTAQVVTASSISNVTGDTTGVDDGSSGSGSGSTTVTNFPNDYSRTGEAQAAANSINAKLDTLHNDLTSTSNPADGSADIPEYDSGLNSTFNNLTSWTLPAHTSTCPTGTFSVWNTTFTLDAQCTVAEQVKPTLSIAMIVVWVLMAMFIVLKA